MCSLSAAKISYFCLAMARSIAKPVLHRGCSEEMNGWPRGASRRHSFGHDDDSSTAVVPSAQAHSIGVVGYGLAANGSTQAQVPVQRQVSLCNQDSRPHIFTGSSAGVSMKVRA